MPRMVEEMLLHKAGGINGENSISAVGDRFLFLNYYNSVLGMMINGLCLKNAKGDKIKATSASRTEGDV